MRTELGRVCAACGSALLGAALALGVGAARVGLSKPFELDKDTIALCHLADVASLIAMARE